MALVKVYNSTKVISNYSYMYSSGRRGNYCPSTNTFLGLYYNPPYYDGTRIWKDGTSIGFADVYGYDTPSDYWQSLEDGSLVAQVRGQYLYPIDTISALPILTTPIADISTIAQTFGGAYNNKLGYFYVCVGEYIRVHSIADASLVETFRPEPGYQYSSIQFRSTNKIICINISTRRVAFYDLTSRTVEYVSYIADSFRQICFDWKNQVFQAIRTDGTVAIYSCDVAPGNLSSPVLVPATVSQRMGNLVYVDLTGDDGEPIPNCWIKWHLSDGRGELEKDYSKTDETGRAWNYYWASSIAGPGTDINVEVVV